MHFNEVKGNWINNYRNDCCQFLLSVVSLHLCMCPIPHALGCRAHFLVGRRSILCGVFSSFFPPTHPPYFLLFITTMGACLRGSVGAHGWIVRFCQPLVQFPSWSWLPKGSKIQEVSGTQPPLSIAVNNKINIDKKNSMRTYLNTVLSILTLMDSEGAFEFQWFFKNVWGYW